MLPQYYFVVLNFFYLRLNSGDFYTKITAKREKEKQEQRKSSVLAQIFVCE